jgi:hypothetical protein
VWTTTAKRREIKVAAKVADATLQMTALGLSSADTLGVTEPAQQCQHQTGVTGRVDHPPMPDRPGSQHVAGKFVRLSPQGRPMILAARGPLLGQMGEVR